MRSDFDLLVDYLRELLLRHPRISRLELHRMVYEEPYFRERLKWGRFGPYPVCAWIDAILGVFEMEGWVRLTMDDMVEVRG